MRVIRGIVAIVAALALASCGVNKDRQESQLVSELGAIDGVDRVEVTFHATAGGLASAPAPKVHGRDDLSPAEAQRVVRRALERVADLDMGVTQFRYQQRIGTGTFDLYVYKQFREPPFDGATFSSLFDEIGRGAQEVKWDSGRCDMAAHGPAPQLSEWFDAPQPKGCAISVRTWSDGGGEVRNAGGLLSLQQLAPIVEDGKVGVVEDGDRMLSVHPADGVKAEQLAEQIASVVGDLPSGHVISVSNEELVVVADGKVALRPDWQNVESKALVEAINAHL